MVLAEPSQYLYIYMYIVYIYIYQIGSYEFELNTGQTFNFRLWCDQENIFTK